MIRVVSYGPWQAIRLNALHYRLVRSASFGHLFSPSSRSYPLPPPHPFLLPFPPCTPPCRLKDDPSLPVIAVNASFVVVEGQLIVGSSSSHFSQRAAFTLLPNPNGRLPYLYTANAPADASHPRSLGHKAFAIVSGEEQGGGKRRAARQGRVG